MTSEFSLNGNILEKMEKLSAVSNAELSAMKKEGKY